MHICRDDGLVCAQRLFPARKHLHRQILQHILLRLHAVCAPFVGDDTDAKLPVRFYDGRTAGTVEFRCRLQHAVDDGIRIFLAAELLLHPAQCAAKGNAVFGDFTFFGAVDIHTQDSFFIFNFAQNAQRLPNPVIGQPLRQPRRQAVRMGPISLSQ